MKEISELQQLAREEFEKQFSYMRPSAIQKARHEVGVLNPNDFEDIECLLDVLIARAFEAGEKNSQQELTTFIHEVLKARAATLAEVKERVKDNYFIDTRRHPQGY